MTWDRSDKHDHAPRWVRGVTGDPLDSIAAIAQWEIWGGEPRRTQFVTLTVEQRDALVEVARAARDLGPILQGERLAAALARLDGPR